MAGWKVSCRVDVQGVRRWLSTGRTVAWHQVGYSFSVKVLLFVWGLSMGDFPGLSPYTEDAQ